MVGDMSSDKGKTVIVGHEEVQFCGQVTMWQTYLDKGIVEMLVPDEGVENGTEKGPAQNQTGPSECG